MNFTTKEELASWAECKIYQFHSADGKAHLNLRQLSARELTKMSKFMKDNGKEMTRPILVALSVVNEEGRRYYDDSDVDTIERTFSVARLRELGECIEQHNGMSDAPEEDAAKNSFATLS